ncbi:MAG: transporter substrate-binding domain-containing protein [Treponema sp.]|jgi:signal transduction histidine kinase/DNA-binding response OmpR family regulator|nr:transporter substrate-binding domain-containing protein [Treponema sp.]
MKKVMIFPVVIFFLIFFSCSKSANQFAETSPYASFRDVPGVTDEEIRAIDALREQRVSFVYGITPSTEAFYSQDNTIKGFTALFCEWLTDFFGISFTPVIYEWGDLLAGLETAEVDFSGDLSPTEERRETYFMTDAIAVRPLKYIRLRSSPSISGIAQTRPLRLVFFDGSVTYDHAVSSLSAAFESFFVKDNEAAYNLLESGRADAVLTENVLEAAFDIYGDVITEDFFPLIYSPVSMATRNPALESVISVVQKALKNRAPYFMTLLYNQGHREYLKHKLLMQLSEDEKAYLQTNPVVPFAAEYDNYPLCFYNAQEKQWQGIAFDVMDEIQSLTGIDFKVVNDRRINWPVMVKMLEVGEVSMLTELLQSEERKGRFIWPSTAIITDNYALLSKSEFRNISINEIIYVRVGLPKGTAYTEIFKRWFPDHEYTKEYESSDSAFQALDRGEVDMVMSSQYRFLLLTNYRELPDYKANVIFDYTFDSTFGFNKNEKILCSITDKALAIINVKGISEQWMRKTFDYRVEWMWTSIRLIIGAVVLGLGLIFMLVLFNRNRGEGRILEKLIEERTSELHRSQLNLEAALEAAKAADRSKSAFLANMSHEIRTPMNSILGFSELAMDGEASQKTRGYLEKISTNAQWLLQIINNILDLSKIESGKMELEKIPFDMHKLLTGCRNLVMPKAVEKGIVLHFYAEPSMGKRPLGDPTRLRQIFVNLLSNAIKFTNTGMVKLHCAVKEVKDKTVEIHFEVKDSGIGMTPEQIEKVFDPFAQAETGTTRKYGGTGLGLPITKDIIEMMGGQLLIESTLGIGSKFSFDLTFDIIEASDKELLEKKMVLHEVGKPMFEGEILLCEDNVMNQQVICEHLARVGLKTVVAENGKVGVDTVQNRMQNGEKQFDLIFMDIHMPVMDGLDASVKIKELNTGVPIVAMTANIMTSDMEIYKTNGMDGCVGKPFTSQELWRCLLKYLEPVSLGETHSDAPKSGLIDENDHIKTELEFQKNIQLSFVKNNQNTYEKIVKALEKGDIKLAHRLAHTLKSNAGHIGKYVLQNAAAKVEEQLKEEKNLAAPQQMDMLKAELEEALAELAPLLEEAEQETEIQVEPIDVERARELLENLEPLLKKGSPDCTNFIDSLRSIPGSEKLINQIDDFDFEAALLSLGEMKEKI